MVGREHAGKVLEEGCPPTDLSASGAVRHALPSHTYRKLTGARLEALEVIAHAAMLQHESQARSSRRGHTHSAFYVGVSAVRAATDLERKETTKKGEGELHAEEAGDHGLQLYEIKRKRNMAENNAVLKQLGLA